MELRDWIEIIGFLIGIITIVIKFNNKVDSEKFEREAGDQKSIAEMKAEKLERELADQKITNSLGIITSNYNSYNRDLERLEERVTDHKDKIELKIDLLETKIENRDIIIGKKIDELKDLIINKMTK